MPISKGKLGALGLIAAGLAQILSALAGAATIRQGALSPEAMQGGATIASGVGLLGIRDKQERVDPEP